MARSAGYDVLSEYQQIRHYHSSYCLGKGKAEEIAEAIAPLNPAKIIFNNRLKPTQRYNLTKLFRTEVIDRFQLILEIFTKRAGTREAKCQIELAKLQYELPMARENVRLAKMGELAGFHGLGKYQADVYTSMIKKRISYLKNELIDISRSKSSNRRRRKKAAFFTIALTGYTFSGKTSIFNRLTMESLPVGTGLFTTLSTTTRAISISGRKVLVSDTVGFIDNLPHLLVESFYTTLEEVTLADRVLLILDSSDPALEFKRKLDTCLSTLNEIGVFNSSIIPVINKVDLSLNTNPLEDRVFEMLGSRPVLVSAKTGSGLSILLNQISTVLPESQTMSVKIPISEDPNPIISWAHDYTTILKISYGDGFVEIEIQGDPSTIQRLVHIVDRRSKQYRKPNGD